MRRRGVADWQEDRELYEQRCVMCDLEFYGHKYRRVCRMCSLWPPWRWQALLRMLGFVPPGMARVMGFTHHALMYGLLPCYYCDERPDACMIELKWRPLWLIEFPIRHLWFLAWVVFGEGEPHFGMKVGKKL